MFGSTHVELTIHSHMLRNRLLTARQPGMVILLCGEDVGTFGLYQSEPMTDSHKLDMSLPAPAMACWKGGPCCLLLLEFRNPNSCIPTTNNTKFRQVLVKPETPF